MINPYLVTFKIGYEDNKAYFWSEKKAKQFVEAIKPLTDSIQVFNVDCYTENFFHK